jgi:hypothetical protein
VLFANAESFSPHLTHRARVCVCATPRMKLAHKSITKQIMIIEGARHASSSLLICSTTVRSGMKPVAFSIYLFMIVPVLRARSCKVVR